MKKSAIWRAIVVALLLFAPVLPLGFAQTGAGTIQGTVMDRTGAYIVGAKVHVVETTTGVSTDTTTTDKGFYTIPSLFVGQYKISIEAPGMTAWEGNISLQVGQTATVNASLAVAGGTTQVTVAGDVTQLITTDSPTQGTTLERERIEQLPMNGRSIAGVISLTVPGYQPGNSTQTAQPHVNGLEWGAFSWVQDGASLDNRDGGGINQQPPDPDSIQEVRVETSNSSAKFDRPGTAIFSTKSGANDLHGSAFLTNRDNSYGIAKSRQDVSTLNAPKYIRNEYGISLGGPIYLPWYWHGRELYRGQNKSFFFVAWERLALRQAQSQSLYVPTDAMRAGNFGGITNANGQAVTLYDNSTTTSSSPWTRQAFPGNQIPIGRISPLAKTLYAVSPHATNAGNPYVAPNWTGVTPNNNDRTSFTTRLDHHFNEQNNAFFRYSYGSSTSNFLTSVSPPGPPTTDNTANMTYTVVHTQSGVLSWSHIFSPTFYNEFVASMSYESDATQTGPNPNHNYAADLGLQNHFGELGYPYISGTSTNGNAANSILMGYGQGNNTLRNNNYINIFDDNLTMIRGPHTLQFGARYRHERLNILPDQPYPARLVFDGLGTALYDPATGTAYGAVNNTGLAAADFFLGDSSFYQNYFNEKYLHLRNQELGTYLQDDYRIKHNLTLNLGLRWEVHPALHERDNQFTGFDVANHAVVTGTPIAQLYKDNLTVPQIVNGLQSIGVKFETTQQARVPSSIINSQYFTFGPRLGAAYKPFDERYGLVLRGGYGTYLFPAPPRNFYGAMNSQVPYDYSFAQDFTNASQTDGLANYILRSQQTVIAGQNSTNVINYDTNAVFSPGSFTMTVLDPHYPLSYVNEWNVTLEKELKGRSALSIAYVANHGSNLEQYWYINTKPSNYVWYVTTGQPLPSGYYSNTATRPYDKTTYGEIQIQRKTGFSNSNALQINYQRLFNKGLAYQISYVWNRAFRDGGNGFRDSIVYASSTFIPGIAPSDSNNLNRYQNYGLDTSVTPVLLRWNWVLDIPVGRNRHFLSGANRFTNALIGGWQLAGDGYMSRGLWHPSTSDWGTFHPLHYYGTKYKVKDCRSSSSSSTICYNAYLGYNGYLPPTQINTNTGVQGLPADYVPSHQPIIPIPPSGPPKGGCSGNPDPNCPYYGTQTVFLTLSNGSKVPTAYSPGPQGVHPYSKLFLLGPFNWNTDASLFKIFPITRTAGLRLQGDFFNVFNQQGTNTPDATTGLISTRTSYITARQIQLTARLMW